MKGVEPLEQCNAAKFRPPPLITTSGVAFWCVSSGTDIGWVLNKKTPK